MLIPHTFTREGHAYRVQGNYVLSTSDILSLNGLCLFDGVPDSIVAHASERGRMVHETIQCIEEKVKLPPRTREAQERVAAYLRFKQATGFEVCGPIERSMVYEHHATEMLVGATPDLIGRIGDEVFVTDLKTCFRQSGKAKIMKAFEWRLQTESYLECLQEDEELWKKLIAMTKRKQVKRAVLHLHPECGITVRGGERLGYEWIPFEMDDTFSWDAAVRMASLKISNGYKIPDRR
jgi:hypothetical protein